MLLLLPPEMRKKKFKKGFGFEILWRLYRKFIILDFYINIFPSYALPSASLLRPFHALGCLGNVI